MIDVENVTKSFNGVRALDSFSLRVERGELYGIVGPNGAGKTTLIKILSTLLAPDNGSVRIADLDVKSRPREIKRLLGYMPDQAGIYQDMTVREFLEFFADAFHLNGVAHRRAVDAAIHRAKLEDRSNVTVEQLSFGMKQRLLLAKTLLHSPTVLLLDEPATGLDPIARIQLREHLTQLQREGVTILISSHILTDLEDICTRIALIGGGRNVTDTDGHSVIDLRAPRVPSRRYEIEYLGNSETAIQLLSTNPATRILQSRPGRLLVEVSGEERQAAEVLRALVIAGVEVARFDHRAIGLEERYRMAFEERHP